MRPSVKHRRLRPLRLLLVAVCLIPSLYVWRSTRLEALDRLLRGNQPVGLAVVPMLMSAAVGPPARAVGYFDEAQVALFTDRGGLYPRSRLDIRDVPARGKPELLWVVDPGVCWVWNFASRCGVDLDVASLTRFQVGADLVALGLVLTLAWRLQGWLAAGLAGLLYGMSGSLAEATVQLGYYYWSIPVALGAAHFFLSALPKRNGQAAWLCGSAYMSLALWLRVLWLPVALVVTAAYGLARPRARWRAACLALFFLGVSYSLMVFRASSVPGGGIMHPRSQLWHTLYIGLGYYGTFGPIRWLDEYAFEKARAAGFDPSDRRPYDRYMRTLFLAEVKAAPLKYLRTLVRRFGEYVEFGRLFVLGPRRGPIAWLGLLAVAMAGSAAVAVRRYLEVGPLLWIGAFYVGLVAIWAWLVPPQPQYAIETSGLVAPLYGSFGVMAVRGVVTWLLRRRTERGAQPG